MENLNRAVYYWLRAGLAEIRAAEKVAWFESVNTHRSRWLISVISFEAQRWVDNAQQRVIHARAQARQAIAQLSKTERTSFSMRVLSLRHRVEMRRRHLLHRRNSDDGFVNT